MDPTLNAQKYVEQLEKLLLLLKEQIDVQSQAKLSSGADQEALDEYLLELNSFYYESFARRFFPDFRQFMTDDIRNLYHIHQQETTLNQAVITSIRQEARLFNQVRQISARLKNQHQEIQSLGLTDQPGSEARSVDLLYIWKEFAQAWISLLSRLRKLQAFLDDRKMLSALNQYPAHVVVSTLLCDWDSQDVKAERDLNRLLAAWQLAVKMLAKFLEDATPDKNSARQLGSELEKIDTSWDNRKCPALLRTWYKSYIQQSFQLYLATLKLGGERNDRPLTLRSAQQMHDWLQALLYIVETGLNYKDRGLMEFISNNFLITGLDPKYLQELAVHSAQVVQRAEQSIQELETSTRAQYSNYSRLCNQIMAEGVHYLRQQLNGQGKGPASFLAPTLQQLKTQLDLLSTRLELLDEKEEFALQVKDQGLVLTDSLGSYLALLQSIQAELVRMLDPRHLKRSFPDMDLHIEHLPITTGALFPRTHRDLVEEGLIRTQAAPGPEGRILSAEGDIFVIRLGDLEEREIPAIIISKEG